LGLAQIKIKRLLAYSTISHLGFILLALAVNTEQSIDSFIFYIIQYTITNLNIFLVILGLTYCLSTNYLPSIAKPYLLISKGELEAGSSYLLGAGGGVASLGNKDISLISEFKGLFFSNPILSISLAVSLFSMAGIPPLIGFFSKQLVLYSALQNGYYFISVLAIIVSVISCSYYLQIIKILLTHSPNNATTTQGLVVVVASQLQIQLQLAKVGGASESPSSYLLGAGGSTSELEAGGLEGHYVWMKKNGILLTNTHSYLISTLTFTILFFFIKPSLILNSTQLLSLSLFYI
jgi:NADH-ubiquinone oxidoreductase chain 2